MQKITEKKNIRHLPPIGLRIVKSSVVIGICYLVSFFRGNRGIVFYSQLAAPCCMKMIISAITVELN